MSSDAKQNKPAYFEWDPTGRYFMSASLVQKNPIENGLIIWSATGRKVTDVKREGLSFCKWRPRPPTLLGNDTVADIKKNLKKYSKKFDDEDRTKDREGTKEQQEMRRAKMDDFNKWRRYLNEQREQLLNEVDDDVRRIANMNTADRDQLMMTGDYIEEIQEVLESREEELVH